MRLMASPMSTDLHTLANISKPSRDFSSTRLLEVASNTCAMLDMSPSAIIAKMSLM